MHYRCLGWALSPVFTRVSGHCRARFVRFVLLVFLSELELLVFLTLPPEGFAHHVCGDHTPLAHGLRTCQTWSSL